MRNSKDKQMENVLRELAEMYLSNAGNPEAEFVSCITPERDSSIHMLWKRAWVLTGGEYIKNEKSN